MELTDYYDGLIVDLDGVVWLGEQPIPGAIDALNELSRTGIRLVLLTNDPRSDRAAYAAKLHRLGYPATAAQVVSSGSATAAHLADDPRTCYAQVFVIGSSALKGELAGAGLTLLAGDDARMADVVVIGGHEGFTYEELRLATQAAATGAELVATNRDATFPMPDGPWPATGAIVAAVETAARRRARCIGKPEPVIFEAAGDLLGDCHRVAVIGDDLTTDIAGASAAGLDSVLVLTGTTARGEAQAGDPAPTWVAASLQHALTDMTTGG